MEKEQLKLSEIAYFASAYDVHECPFFAHLHELKLREHEFDYYGPAGPLARPLGELTLNSFEFPELVAKEEPGQLNAVILRGCLEVVPQIEKLWSEFNSKPKLIIADVHSLYAAILARKHKIPILALYPGFFVNSTSHSFDQVTEKILSEPIEEHLKPRAEEVEKMYGYKISTNIDLFVQGDRNISAFIKEFGEKMAPETETSTYIGPSFMDDKKIDDETLLDVELGKENLVFVSLGLISFVKNAFSSLETIIEALKDTKYTVLISTTEEKAEEIFKKGIPTNFIVRGPVPTEYVLQNSNLFITHFGPQGIMRAIENKVPMVGIPRARDHFANGEVVEKLHLGKMLREVTPESIKKAVEETISSKEIKKALEQHQSMIHSKKSREKFFEIVAKMYDFKPDIHKYDYRVKETI